MTSLAQFRYRRLEELAEDKKKLQAELSEYAEENNYLREQEAHNLNEIRRLRESLNCVYKRIIKLEKNFDYIGRSTIINLIKEDVDQALKGGE